MAEIKDYSTTAASNSSASPAGWPEGMAPSGVNDSDRELAARVSRWYEDAVGVNSLAGGTLNYTLAASRTISAYAAGDTFLAVCNATNTAGTVTLNVDSVGAKNVVDNSQTALDVGQLIINGIYLFSYDATNDVFICLNPSGAGLGSVLLASGTVSTSSSLDITDLTADYAAYLLTYTGLVAATGGDSIWVRVSEDNGSNFEEGASDYRWSVRGVDTAGTENTNGDGADSEIQITHGGISGSIATAGNIWIYAPMQTVRTQLTHMRAGSSDAGTFSRGAGAGEYATSVGPHNAIRFMLSTGNITTMRYAIYGMRE